MSFHANGNDEMQTDKPLFPVTRRRFAFWVGFGLFSIGEKLHARGFDELAAAAMRGAGQDQGDEASSIPEHWRAAENRTWRWFEREHLIDGQWKSTGLTTPIHKRTGEAYSGHTGYLNIDLVPTYLRLTPSDDQFSEEQEEEFEAGEPRPDPVRQARHGRPPSKWLRSLHAAELRLWLRTIRVPEAGVEGMTFWTHLTRDHFFSPKNIAGLTENEQAKLHAAAHHGY